MIGDSVVLESRFILNDKTLDLHIGAILQIFHTNTAARPIT